MEMSGFLKINNNIFFNYQIQLKYYFLLNNYIFMIKYLIRNIYSIKKINFLNLFFNNLIFFKTFFCNIF
jgi:hypothetical protein